MAAAEPYMAMNNKQKKIIDDYLEKTIPKALEWLDVSDVLTKATGFVRTNIMEAYVTGAIDEINTNTDNHITLDGVKMEYEPAQIHSITSYIRTRANRIITGLIKRIEHIRKRKEEEDEHPSRTQSPPKYTTAFRHFGRGYRFTTFGKSKSNPMYGKKRK